MGDCDREGNMWSPASQHTCLGTDLLLRGSLSVSAASGVDAVAAAHDLDLAGDASGCCLRGSHGTFKRCEMYRLSLTVAGYRSDDVRPLLEQFRAFTRTLDESNS